MVGIDHRACVELQFSPATSRSVPNSKLLYIIHTDAIQYSTIIGNTRSTYSARIMKRWTSASYSCAIFIHHRDELNNNRDYPPRVWKIVSALDYSILFDRLSTFIVWSCPRQMIIQCFRLMNGASITAFICRKVNSADPLLGFIFCEAFNTSHYSYSYWFMLNIGLSRFSRINENPIVLLFN